MGKISNELLVAPEIWAKDKWWDELFLFLWGSFGLQIIATLVNLVLVNTSWSDDKINISVNFISYAIIFYGYVLFLFFVRKDIGKIILAGFKKDHWKKILYGWFAFIVVNFISTIYMFFVEKYAPGYGSSNNNQQSLNSIASFVFPFILMTVVMGPICEELCYRVGLCSLIARGNKLIALIITTLVFGFLHFDWSSILLAINGQTGSLINELWNIPSYLFAGLGLGYAYMRYGCFSASISGHMANNLIAAIQIYV